MRRNFQGYWLAVTVNGDRNRQSLTILPFVFWLVRDWTQNIPSSIPVNLLAGGRVVTQGQQTDVIFHAFVLLYADSVGVQTAELWFMSSYTLISSLAAVLSPPLPYNSLTEKQKCWVNDGWQSKLIIQCSSFDVFCWCQVNGWPTWKKVPCVSVAYIAESFLHKHPGIIKRKLFYW